MENQKAKNVKLGIFTIAGLLFMVFMLYMIGSSRNLFSSNFEIKARFHTVNGLMVGNNVRLSGIDVGTVKRIEIINDTSVQVIMVIEKRVRKFIKKNSLASVGTDGLIGSKLVNINFVSSMSDPIESGDMLNSLRPIEGDEMLRTLNTTNLNLANITDDMKLITGKLNSNNSLWSILKDTVVAENLKQTVLNARLASRNVANSSISLQQMITDTEQGKGLLGTLLVDTLLSNKLKVTVENVSLAGSQLKSASEEIKKLSSTLNSGEGALNMLFTDTTFREDLRSSMININKGTERFSENMEALKHNYFFRGYFKKLEKENQKKK